MNGPITKKVVLDSCWIINRMKARTLDTIIDDLPNCNLYISNITRIELYSFHKIDNDEINRLDSFMKDVSVIPLSDAVEQQTIAFRKATNCKLPDSIIAATAILLDATVLTNDMRFGKVKFGGLKMMLLE